MTSNYIRKMYQCEKCKKTAPARTKCQFVIIERRDKYYSSRAFANPGFARKGSLLKKSKKRRDRVSDPGGRGWEIAHESKMCPQCAGEFFSASEVTATAE